jgi:protein TonB
VRDDLRRLAIAVALGAAAATARAAELAVEWAPLSRPVEAFQIERRVDEPGEAFSPLARVGGDATKFLDRNVREGVRYCYRVRGVRGASTSPPSPELCSIATEPALEPAPQLLQVAAPEPEREPAFVTGGVTREARPIRRPRPVYPPAARLNEVSGWVKLSYVVNADGTVRDVKVMASEPPGVFDQAATDAARQFLYSPRMENGVAVDGPTVETEITFQMENPGGTVRHDPDPRGRR